MAKYNERPTGEIDRKDIEEGVRYRFDINEYTNIVDNGKKRAAAPGALNKGFFILVLIVVVALIVTVTIFVSSFNDDSAETLRPPTDTDTIIPPIILADPEGTEEDEPDAEEVNIDTVESLRGSVVTVTGYFNDITDTRVGTGVIFSDDGYIVTVSEIVQDASLITVTLDNGDEYRGSIIGYDTKTGIAVLDIDVDNLTRAVFTSGNNTEVAEILTIIGSPRFSAVGGSGGASQAMVSATEREIKTAIGYTALCMEVDMIANEYSKGAPAINSDGNIIGIIIGFSESGGYLLYGEEIARVVNAIVNGNILEGRVTIGADVIEISDIAAEQYNLPKGLMISEIDEESALYRAGAEVGDIITEVDGVSTTLISELYEEIALHDMGNPITITIYFENPNGSYSTEQLSLILTT